jgi:transposase
MPRKKSYTPAPPVPPELMQRLALIVEVLAGMRTVSDAARALGISRNHFQTILHRGVTGLTDSITPKQAGRPARPREVAVLQAQIEKLKRENERLQDRVGSTERLLAAASGLLHGRIRPTGRQTRTLKTRESTREDNADPDPEAQMREALARVEEMRELGLSAPVAARVAGVHASTVRRWRARAQCNQPLVRRHASSYAPVACELKARAREIVRTLNGLVGAQSLARSVEGISRRQAARVKAETLIEMERARKAALRRITITTPGVLRGMDAMHLHSAEGRFYALFCADGAVPYRTSVKTGKHYDADFVARTLAADIEANGAPIVYRLDRARAHDAPAARALLEANEILVLHGPPRYPRFYGQLERQNREHRAWGETLKELGREELEPCLEKMLHGVNDVWKRRTLGWRTAAEAWNERPNLQIDRRALREEVQERTSRIARELECRGKPADLAERLAIEQALQSRGYLRQEIGGWC